jgi:hypothetical protein
MIKKNNFSDEISRIAYELYEKRGKVQGRELEDWLQAEKIFMERNIKEIEKEAEAVRSTKRKKTSGTTIKKAAETTAFDHGQSELKNCPVFPKL